MEDYILCITLFDLKTASTGDLTYPKVEKKSFQYPTTVLIEHISNDMLIHILIME